MTALLPFPHQEEPLRTPAQNRTIHGLVSELAKASGLERDDVTPTLRTLCRAASGQEHTSQLSEASAKVVIRGLQQELGKYRPASAARGKALPDAAPHEPWGARGGPARLKLVTARQRAVLAEVFRLVGMDTPERVAGFCQRQCGHPQPRTHAEYDQVIGGLRGILVRTQNRPEELRARAAALVGHRGLDAWKAGFVADLLHQYDTAGPGAARVFTPAKLIKLVECEVAVAASRAAA